MADMNRRLHGLGDFDVEDPGPVASLQARARRRKRAKLGWSGVACATIAAIGALVLTGNSSPDDVATTGEADVPTTEEQGSVVVPSVVGSTVHDAMEAAEAQRLRAEVDEGDADLAGAVVIAQEPPAGQSVSAGSVIGLRTALPDTTAAQECPGTSHPHDRPESADALPLVEQVERAAVEAVQESASASEGQRLVLGLWTRWAYELDEAGAPVMERVDGVQLMAIYDTTEDCPDLPPTFISGAPVTRVILDRTDFGSVGGDPDQNGAAGPWSEMSSPPIGVRSGMTVVWTGTEVLVVGGVDIREGAGADGRADGTSVEPDGTTTPIHEDRGVAAAAYSPASDQWRRLPDMPFTPTTVEATTWTGTELLMLVHEQVGIETNGSVTETRILRLDPDSDEWEVEDAPDRVDGYYWQLASAYTGSEWILWGYPYHQPDSQPLAVAYEPATGSWRDIDPGPLGFRELPGSVWTGEEMIVFGGDTSDSYDLGDPPAGEGAAYDPARDSWRQLPPASSPDLRGPSLVWTGSEVLVWGGSFGPSNPSDGSVYDPATDAWRPMAPSPLYGRDDAVAVWAGDRLVIVDGTPTYSSSAAGASAATYDPVSDVWTAIPDPPGGAACNSAGAATPAGVIVLGGSIDCTSITTPRNSVLLLDPSR